MQWMGNMSGSSPVIKKYKVAAAMTTVGVIVTRAAANATGISLSTTTSSANSVGLLLDNGAGPAVATGAGPGITYSTTQADPEAVYSVLVNPDAILRALFVSQATGTSLSTASVTTASTTGLSATATTAPTGFTDFTNPEQDEGTIWYTTGANAGKSRKITSTAATVVTVIMPFPLANAVGDLFITTSYFPGLQFVTSTTNLANIRNDVVGTSGMAMGILDLELNGTTDSYVQVLQADSVWAYTT